MIKSPALRRSGQTFEEYINVLVLSGIEPMLLYFCQEYVDTVMRFLRLCLDYKPSVYQVSSQFVQWFLRQRGTNIHNKNYISKIISLLFKAVDTSSFHNWLKNGLMTAKIGLAVSTPSSQVSMTLRKKSLHHTWRTIYCFVDKHSSRLPPDRFR